MKLLMIEKYSLVIKIYCYKLVIYIWNFKFLNLKVCLLIMLVLILRYEFDIVCKILLNIILIVKYCLEL